MYIPKHSPAHGVASRLIQLERVADACTFVYIAGLLTTMLDAELIDAHKRRGPRLLSPPPTEPDPADSPSRRRAPRPVRRHPRPPRNARPHRR
jgi:hypothetical protein